MGSRKPLLATVLPLALLLQVAGPDARADEPVELAKTFVAQMAAGQFDKAVEPFNDTMKRAMPANKLKELWDELVKECGPLKRATETRTEAIGPYKAVFVTCEFQRAALDVKVVFTSDKKVAGLFFVPSGKYRPPSYADLSKFDEQEVSVASAPFALPGTLSLPKGDGPFPAVVLVHGSGPNDRDETIGPNKPFRDLAHGLASRGIAVLRYEKRTKQYPLLAVLELGSFTVKQETVDDAAAAVELLEKQKKIDPKRIFVLGHSMGGMLLGRIGKAKAGITGFISMAGATRPLEDIVLEETKYLVSLEGKPTEEGEKKLRETEQQVAQVKSPELSIKSGMLLGAPPSYWLDLRGYDPAKEAADLHKPMLILQGERDYMSTMEDFAFWKKALGSRNDVEFRSYPTLNHLFEEGKGKSTPAEYSMPGNVAPVVIADIAKWIEGVRP